MTEKNTAETVAEDGSKIPDAKKFQVPLSKATALHQFPESLDACLGRKQKREMSKLAKVKSKMTVCLSLGFPKRRAGNKDLRVGVYLEGDSREQE